MHAIVYLTCEIKGRDLDSRALIAAHLAKLGITTVLGQGWNLLDNAAAAPRGCFHFKTSNRIQGGWIALVQRSGHLAVAADEEALGSSEALAASTTDAGSILACDVFLALNAAHVRALQRAFPAAAGKVKIAGTARADLLRAARYAAPHPRAYVLLNTSFALFNSAYGALNKAIQVYAGGMRWDIEKDPEHQRIMKNRLDYESASLLETRRLLEWLTERGDIDIVLRPHPMERASWWRERYGKSARLHIVEDSDPFPWMRHADLMIHSDSTTGVESAIMGRPCLNLSPERAWADRLVLREINFTVDTAAQAKPEIERFLSTKAGPIADAAHADPFPTDSAERTARELAALLPPATPVAPFSWAKTPREEYQRKKFTVTPDEFRTSLAMAFEMAGPQRYEVEDLADSVVAVRPR